MQNLSNQWLESTVATAPIQLSQGAELLPEEAPLELREYWSPIRRHYRIIAMLFIVAECLTLLVLYISTPLYTGITTILIERQTPEVLESKTLGERADPDSTDTFYKTQYEMLKSRSLAARVIRDLALDKNTTFTSMSRGSSATGSRWLRKLFSLRQAQSQRSTQDVFGVESKYIDLYLSQLTIQPVTNTSLVSIAFTSPDPALSAEIANTHVRAFIRQGYEQHARSGEDAERFLEGKLDELEARIERSEAALNKYRRERGILAFSLDDKDQMISARMAELNRDMVQAEAQRIALEADVQTIKSDHYDALPAVVDNQLIQKLREESSRLEGQYASLSNQFTTDYPPVAQLRAQVKEAQRREQEEIEKVVGSIKAKYQSAVERENELRAGFEQEKAQVMSLNDASLQDVILAREVDTNRALYQSVLERIKLLGIASESQVTNISVVDPAEMPIRASSPKKELSLVFAGFLALLIGGGTAFVKEAADSGLKTSEEVQGYLGLPNLATVLHIPSSNIWEAQPKELLSLNTDRAQVPVEKVPVSSMCAAASEAYRAIRTGILLSRAERSPRMILFTSGKAGEGKSLTAINSARVFAQMLDRVLLIDADLRRPRCHEILGAAAHPGLTETLTGLCEFEDVVQPTAVKGLFLLSAGLTPPNPSELLSSGKMRELLAVAASSYEYVLIDSPPILPVSDSVVLSALVDGVVIVANAQTPKLIVREGCARLLYIGARILGIVLNDVDPQQRSSYAPYYLYS